MGFLETVLGCPNEIRPTAEGFGWNTAGLGVKYLLIRCEDGRPVAAVHGADRRERARLVEALDAALASRQECLLLGVETTEVSCRFFQLEPAEARRRLAPKA